MRIVALVLLLAALAGCKSSRDRPDRHYTSVNRDSVDFLFETVREGNRVRKKSLKQTLAFSKRAPGNRAVRRNSVGFAWESFWAEEWSGFRDIFVESRKIERKSGKERLASMRFGFLDSGD